MVTTVGIPIVDDRPLNTGIKWVAPRVLWEQAETQMNRPFLTEFDTDRFLPVFLEMMNGKRPLILNPPQDIIEKQASAKDKPDVFKLYQPLHRRYYLVTGSLVCRQFGLPDRTVVRKNGEKTSFVLRRIVTRPDQSHVEVGWVNDGPNNTGWQPVVDDMGRENPLALLPKEERLPVHPVQFCPAKQAGAGTGTTAARSLPCEGKNVYYGYISVDSREKYLAPASNIAERVQEIVDSPKPGDPNITDPRLDDVATRVVAAWHALSVSQADVTVQQQVSLYVIVDLGEFLKNHLKNVFKALPNNGAKLREGSARKKLLDELNAIKLNVLKKEELTPKEMPLAEAIIHLQDSGNLARAESEPPQDKYNLYKSRNENYLRLPPAGQPDQGGPFYQLLRNALKEKTADSDPLSTNQKPETDDADVLKIPRELDGLIKDEPIDSDSYFVRLVYEHAPCDPVLSDPSHPFTFAKVFDPDAPARHLRIELPSIKLKDLRKYKRGIGMQMSPELNDVVNRLDFGQIKGIFNDNKFVTGGSAIGIAYICSFSIPIITICAFIVLFIFLILLNIVFWWLPFIRICFPIPTRK